MAEPKVDLPEDLMLAAKDDVLGGNTGSRGLKGLLDEPKDQATSENNIPLSPQWLNFKPSESKFGISAASGETRSPISLPQGNSSDSIHKDVWRLDGSHDKKDWKRNVPDIEINHRWREEERETGLLGRRERRKEGDRENEFRKNRIDTISSKETSDSKTLPPSDRWREASNRNTGHENRRDSKWSSRWGPEGKEDTRTEKKIGAEKEDSQIEKQNRILSESDSRDKWRPRHRQEAISSGSVVYRAAPGFGTGRGRGEVSNVGFAPGRGRSNLLQFSRSSSDASIGAALISKRESHTDKFCYPRGKLLDIYRKHKILSSFDTTPDGLEDVPPITLTFPLTPLAFAKPDLEEEAVLEEILKVNLTSSEVFDGLNEVDIAEFGEHVIGSDVGERKDTITVLSIGTDPVDKSSIPSKEDTYFTPARVTYFEQKTGQPNLESYGQLGLSDPLMDVNFGSVNRAASFDDNDSLTNDVNYLRGASSYIDEMSGIKIQHQSSNNETEHLEQSISEESTLFYLDPEGITQGPFFVEDIITWYGEGYFGLDLLVCFSDAPEGTPFRKLGELIPNLGLRPQPKPQLVHTAAEHLNPSADTRGHLDDNVFPSEYSIPSANKSQKWIPSGSEGSNDHEDSIHSHNETIPLSHSDIFDGNGYVGIHTFNNFVGQDDEEVLSSIQTPSDKLVTDLHGLPLISGGHQHLMSEMGQASYLNHEVHTGNHLNPLGLSWSELEGAHQKGPLSSNIGGVGDRVRTFNPPAVASDSFFRNEDEDLRLKDDYSIGHDAWSSHQRRNSTSASQLSRFDLEEHLLSQRFQKEKLQQQQQLLSLHQNMHSTGAFQEHLQGPMRRQLSMNNSIPDMEQLLNLQLEQQHHLQQLEHQQQLHQQQQLRHQQLRHQMQQQLILEQLQHQQMHNPGFGSMRNNIGRQNLLDQVLYRKQLLHELQQQAHHRSLNHEQSLERLIQAKLGHNLRHENRNEILEALSDPRHRHMLSREQQFLLDSQQYPISARNQPGIDEERHVGGVWSIDESGQFVRAGSNSHQILPSRPGHLDNIQPNHIERDFLVNDRIQRGNYDQILQRRNGPDVDHRNAFTRIQELNMMKHHGQMEQFHSGNSSHQNWMSNQFSDSHLDAMGGWAEPNTQLRNNLEESQLTQLHLAVEKHRREIRTNLSSGDPNQWASLVGNDVISDHRLADLLHQKQVLQSSQPLGLINDVHTSSYENRDPSWFFPPHATDQQVNVVDKVGSGDHFRDHSFFTNIGQAQERPVTADLDGKANIFEATGRLAFQSSGGLPEEEQYFPDIEEIQREQIADSMAARLLRERMDFSDVNEGMMSKKHSSKGMTMSSGIEQAGASVDHENLEGSNGGGMSLYNSEMGAYNNAQIDETTYDRMSGIFSKEHTLSSQGSSSELRPAVTTPMKGKYERIIIRNPSSVEASFVDMLKSTAKKPGPDPDSSSDFAKSGPGGGSKSVQKKGKKGRQIDPSLLGFKVHSNRILMGEIHRPDD